MTKLEFRKKILKKKSFYFQSEYIKELRKLVKKRLPSMLWDEESWITFHMCNATLKEKLYCYKVAIAYEKKQMAS